MHSWLWTSRAGENRIASEALRLRLGGLRLWGRQESGELGRVRAGQPAGRCAPAPSVGGQQVGQGGRHGCFELLQNLGVGGSRVTLGSSSYWLQLGSYVRASPGLNLFRGSLRILPPASSNSASWNTYFFTGNVHGLGPLCFLHGRKVADLS